MVERIDFDGIRRDLARSARAVCDHLIGGGKTAGREYIAPGGRSLSVNLETGVWADFGGDGSGSLIDLWAWARGCDVLEAAKRADAWLRTGNENDFDRGDPGPRPGGRNFAPPPVAVEPPPAPGEPADGWWYGQKASRCWDYRTIDGELWAQAYRFEHPSGVKAVRPWDPKAEEWKYPKPPTGEGRPLLYLDEIMARPMDPVVITAGEKACDAVRELGMLATTNMGGESSIGIAEWSTLAERNVIHWRDKDTAGRHNAGKMEELLRAAGVASLHAVEMPAEAKPKDDAADFPADVRREMIEGAMRGRPIIAGKPRLVLSEWGAGRFVGEAPEQRYLVNGSIPIGAVSLAASEGGLGKSMIVLNLAVNVAFGDRSPRSFQSPETGMRWAFGGAILEHGRAVVMSAEDTDSDLHRRIKLMDPHNLRQKWPDRLITVPLPNMGGNFPLIRMKGGVPELTEEFDRLRDQLAAIEDLRLLAIDPLARFAAAKVESDLDAGQMLIGALGALAVELDIAVVLMHHMTKSSGEKADQGIRCPDTARKAIRGSTGLVDGPRLVYAFWPEADQNTARAALAKVGRQEIHGDEWRKAVVYGAVVKSNGPADQTVRTFIRTEAGILLDRTPLVKESAVKELEAAREAPPVTLETMLVNTIRAAAEASAAFTRTEVCEVKTGRRHDMPPELAVLPKETMRDLLNGLLHKKLVTINTRKKLDVPTGPEAKGMGTTREGAPPTDEIRNAGRST